MPIMPAETPAVNAPAAREGLIRLEPDQPLAAAKRVGRTRHRLDRDAASVHVRKRIAREHHHVGVLLIDPERELAAPLGVSQLDASPAVVAALEVGEGVVQHGRADRASAGESRSRSPRPEGCRPGCRARPSAATVRAGHAQRERIHAAARRSRGKDGCRCRTGTDAAREFGGGRPHEQAFVREQRIRR